MRRPSDRRREIPPFGPLVGFQGQAGIVEQLLLPALVQAGGQVHFFADLRDRDFLDQMSTQYLNFVFDGPVSSFAHVSRSKVLFGETPNSMSLSPQVPAEPPHLRLPYRHYAAGFAEDTERAFMRPCSSLSSAARFRAAP